MPYFWMHDNFTYFTCYCFLQLPGKKYFHCRSFLTWQVDNTVLLDSNLEKNINALCDFSSGNYGISISTRQCSYAAFDGSDMGAFLCTHTWQIGTSIHFSNVSCLVIPVNIKWQHNMVRLFKVWTQRKTFTSLMKNKTSHRSLNFFQCAISCLI